MKISKIINLRRLEKQKAITNRQAELLRSLIDFYKKRGLKHNHSKIVRIASILTKPKTKDLINKHEELIKSIKLPYEKEKKK